MALAMWRQLTGTLDTRLLPLNTEDTDEEGGGRDDVAFSIPSLSFSSRDTFLQFAHVGFFEDCIHDYLRGSQSFRDTENALDNAVSLYMPDLENEIQAVTAEFVQENDVLVMAREFDKMTAPFDIFFTSEGVYSDISVGAIYADFRAAGRSIKKVTLNRVSDSLPYFVSDEYPIKPSTLTYLLKYAIRFMDGLGVAETSLVKWPRNFCTTALIVDYMRSEKRDRMACAAVLTTHCSHSYRVPRDLAFSLLAHLSFLRTPYQSSEFKIVLEFEPSFANITGTVTACYF